MLINHASNPDNTISFFNLEDQKLKYKLRNKHDNCSCYVDMAQMMQCKDTISLNQGFNLNLIGKCWHIRDKITQSINDGSYASPRLKIYILEINDVKLFLISNVEDLGDEILSQFIPTCYEEININEIEINQ